MVIQGTKSYRVGVRNCYIEIESRPLTHSVEMKRALYIGVCDETAAIALFNS
jgi:hypothetical protein